VFIPAMGHVMLTFLSTIDFFEDTLQNSALVKPAEIKITALNSTFYVLVRNHGMANAGCICRTVHQIFLTAYIL
jgi:hypothetical protein